MSSRSPDTDTSPATDPDTPTGKTTGENTVTTKYSTRNSDDNESPQPACFTDNTKQLRQDFLDLPPEPQEEPETRDEADDETGCGPREVPGGKTYKYGDLINKEKIKSIEEVTEDPSPQHDTPEFIVKGNFHSEIRFLERGDLSHDDAPETLQEAWNQGVQVGVDHFDREDFYGYKRARYNEIADIVMLMNDDGMIETTLSVFEETMVIQTGHLHRCGDPDCGRLYDTRGDSECCHWCGYSHKTGRLPTEAEILPQRHTEPEEESTHSLDTKCDDCGEVFNTLTRLRLHDC